MQLEYIWQRSDHNTVLQYKGYDAYCAASLLCMNVHVCTVQYTVTIVNAT